ncbi:MAG: copper chaperone PCu(A)C [Thiobacillaceae bacterium]|nr:copper chaperone PCu(A)C [Thiobacillaceae bacterium]MCX7674183.1 copper chaperone PCu(A)C [Thiobacillaceae bacterium]MDW8322879.1 copper chaperone PCu(A)C [Burkholderiales bacterium]
MKRHATTALLGLLFAVHAWAAQVQVAQPWARATAPGQRTAAGFMDLTAAADLKLVGASSPVSAKMELHTMRMEGGMMVMRQVEDIALPKGQTVNLKPGGLHLMFIDLKKPMKAGDKVPVTLVFKDGAGKEHKLDVQLDVRADGKPMSHGH